MKLGSYVPSWLLETGLNVKEDTLSSLFDISEQQSDNKKEWVKYDKEAAFSAEQHIWIS